MLLCITDHCLKTRDRINVIVAGKHAAQQWLDIDSAGDVPTLETLAAVDFLRTHLRALRVRVVNVVDLLALQPEDEHPHGKSGEEFEKPFTPDRPVIFAFHGYREVGSTTTPFDMTVVSGLSRYQLAEAAVLSVEGLPGRYHALPERLRECLDAHHHNVREHGEDMPQHLTVQCCCEALRPSFPKAPVRVRRG